MLIFMARTPEIVDSPDLSDPESPPEMRLEFRDPRTLKVNPLNHRQHGNLQRTAFAELLDDIGWLSPLILNERTGHLIDGHMRRDEAIERNLDAVPVIVVDLPADKESEAVFFLDRVGAMAGTDGHLEALLAQQFETDQELLRQLQSNPSYAGEKEDEGDDEEVEDHRRVGLVPGEAFNYVVILFRSELDWVAAQEHFEIEPVLSPFHVKPSLGVGRVIDGSKYLRRIL